MAGLKDIPARVNRPDWKVVGYDEFGETLRPTEETILSSNPADILGPQIPTKTGKLYITIADARGNTDKVYVSNRNPDNPKEPGAVDAQGNPTWFVTEGPGAAPAAPAATPAKPTASGQLDRLDANGRVIPPTDTTTRAAKMRDPATGAVVDLPDPAKDTTTTPVWIPDTKDGTKEIQVVYQGTTAVPLTLNGVVVSRPKQKAAGEGPQTAGAPHWVPKEGDDTQEIEVVTTTENGVVTNKPTGATRKKPPPEPTAASQLVYQDIEGQPGKQQGGLIVDGKFVPVPGQIKDKDQKPVAVYGTGPNDEFLMVLDDKGAVVSQSRNPNYKKQPGTQLTADTVSEFIQILKPDGTVESVKNTNRITVGEAMANLMQQAGLKVKAGQMSMDDAKSMLTGAVNLMNANTAAQTAMATTAGNVLDATSRNATTGGSLLSNRAQAAQGTLQGILGIAGQGQRSGNMGGGLMSVPAGLGEGLVGGITNWTRDMFGGDDTLASAARLVQQADPESGHGQNSALAFGVLGQMLQKYKELNGGAPHPADASTAAAAASGQKGGLVAPVTGPAGQSYWEQLRAQAAASQAANPLPTPNPAPNLGPAQGFQQLAPYFKAPAGMPLGSSAPSFSQPFEGQWPTFQAPAPAPAPKVTVTLG